MAGWSGEGMTKMEWIVAEVKQREGAGEDDEGVEVVCARGEGLMVRPREGGSKL